MVVARAEICTGMQFSVDVTSKLFGKESQVGLPSAIESRERSEFSRQDWLVFQQGVQYKFQRFVGSSFLNDPTFSRQGSRQRT